MTRYAGRTANGIPRQARAHAEHPVLRIDGLVTQPRDLTPTDIDTLPHVPYTGSVSCLEGGNMPTRNWSGVRLSDIIAIAGVAAAARYVRVSAGPYGVPVAIADAGSVLLCDRIAGEPIGVEQGGPWRLVVPGRLHYTSVKWVDRLELTADEPDDSASRLAAARARARERRSREDDTELLSGDRQ